MEHSASIYQCHFHLVDFCHQSIKLWWKDSCLGHFYPNSSILLEIRIQGRSGTFTNYVHGLLWKVQSAASDYFVALFINYFSIVKYTYEKCYFQCQFLSFGQPKNNKKSALKSLKRALVQTATGNTLRQWWSLRPTNTLRTRPQWLEYLKIQLKRARVLKKILKRRLGANFRT